MTDEHNENNEEQPFIFGGGIPVPQELIEKIQAHRDMHQMHDDISAHNTIKFLTDMDKEKSESMLNFLQLLAADPAEYIAFYAGFMASQRHHRDNICAACHKDHDKSLEEMAHEGHPHESPLDVDALKAKIKANEEEYGVEPIPNTGLYRCINCGIQYPSLEDRMLKKPGIDGCHGCQHKQAHG
jgi:DNA-directed RNA polymerase subunit RPC12/RpoP